MKFKKQLIANEIQVLLEPLSKYLLVNYMIDIKAIVLSDMNENIPTQLAQPQGYVDFLLENSLINQ